METKAIVTYVMCDDIIKSLKIKEDQQIRMSMAEVMTTAIISAVQYSGNLEKARKALKTDRYIPNMLSKSQLNRRIHKIPKNAWAIILEKLHSEFQKYNVSNEFIVDSFPVPACKLARQNRTKLYRERKYLGYCAAKTEYFIGFKLHMLSDSKVNPVTFQLRPASESDIGAFRKFNLNLPKNSVILADKAYNDYKY